MRSRVALVLLLLAACEEHGSGGNGSGDAKPMVGDGGGAQPVGRLCESTLVASDPTTLATPALDCVTRLCLHVEGQSLDMCTAECVTASDCAGVPESPCAAFECVIPISVGPFACRRMCVCANQIPPTGFPIGCD